MSVERGKHEIALRNILRMGQDTRMTYLEDSGGKTDPMHQIRNIIAYCKVELGLPPDQDFLE